MQGLISKILTTRHSKLQLERATTYHSNEDFKKVSPNKSMVYYQTIFFHDDFVGMQDIQDERFLDQWLLKSI